LSIRKNRVIGRSEDAAERRFEFQVSSFGKPIPGHFDGSLNPVRKWLGRNLKLET